MAIFSITVESVIKSLIIVSKSLRSNIETDLRRKQKKHKLVHLVVSCKAVMPWILILHTKPMMIDNAHSPIK